MAPFELQVIIDSEKCALSANDNLTIHSFDVLSKCRRYTSWSVANPASSSFLTSSCDTKYNHDSKFLLQISTTTLSHRIILPNDTASEMAPSNPLTHRRTHNLLLINKLLNFRENASPFTLILDSLEQRGKPLLREMMKRAAVCVYLFSSLVNITMYSDMV